MKRYLNFPLVKGEASRQAHADLPEGTYEREMSKEGFFGPAAFFYHRNPPTAWTDFDGPLAPRAFDLTQINEAPNSLWSAPVVLHNSATEIRLWRLADAMTALDRNGDGDQLLFVHRGSGDFFCDFGHLAIGQGDYVVIPRGTMWRIVPTEPLQILAVEATNCSYTLPDKGLLGPHAIFDPAVMDTPEIDEAFHAQQGDTETRVAVKKRGQVSWMTYPFNPLDAVGWHGELSVARLNVRDIRPIMSHRYHVPPSAHTTFLADRFVICTFAPRPFETDPKALKVPFFHNNDDYDEVLFYHDGDFFSRDNIHPGMMTLHPCGFTHGPHPKALTRMFEQPKPMTDEYAVMIDTRDPLEIGEAASAVEWTGYKDSWKSKS
ncbi:homogentisate 1,2-dioxygenase [Sphingosinicella sp.]|uniref:homogentisate 1,2-dioxygenase n=1 Tax=Sphingosinicella sp. TaxID=1917971 RepID=UPI0017910F67|nr:homogentisate 1,2-dioxygenase [Sphingosinicella sp.]MBA4758511.1 homogentisate 1,2-dioxygenase [Sphingosinicella sp.]